MDSSPKISVIIPTYNRALLLKKAIESVLNQTVQDYEIIVIDDGSTDDTREIVNSFSSPKIKYLYQKNSGRSHARNQGLKIAKGRYIAYLDSDDMFLPDKLERQISILDENKDFGMVYTSARVFDENGIELFNQDKFGNKRLYYEATDTGWIYNKIAFYIPLTIILPSVIVRSEIQKKVGYFDVNLHRFEDTDMWRRISKECKIYAMSEPLCIIRTHSGNKMEHPDDVYNSITHYVSKIFNEDKDVDIILKKIGASKLYLHYAIAVFLNPDYSSVYSIKYFTKALSYNPYFMKSLISLQLIILRMIFEKMYRIALNFIKKGFRYCIDALKAKKASD